MQSLLGAAPVQLGGRRFLLVCAVVAAGVLLALAVHLPFMRLSRLLYLGYGAQGHSLISAVNALTAEGYERVTVVSPNVPASSGSTELGAAGG